MKSQLNIKAISRRARELGLSQANLAETLQVSRESVSKWFKNEKFPRPDKLLKLARALDLSFGEMVISILTVDDSVVAFRRKGGRKITPDYVDQARDMGRILGDLVPLLLFDDLSQPAILKSPSLDYAYIQKAALRVRKNIGIQENEKIEFYHLIKFFNDLHAVIVPVLWGNKENHENALHIYLPESMTTWIYLNLDCRLHDFKYWMAHELGHVHTPQLKENEGEDFADAFAGALLFPEMSAEREYGHLRGIQNVGRQINHIKSVAEQLVVSPLTVYYEINKYASHHRLPQIDLESGKEIHKATSNFNKLYKSLSEYLFNTSQPSPTQYIACAKENFGSPFFDILREYVTANRKSASFIQSLLNIPLLDAQNLFEELC